MPETRAEEIAREMGHDVQADPGGMSTVQRWTCVRCGRAVLDSGRVIYGSAATQICTGEEPC